LEKLKISARSEYEHLQQQNVDIVNANLIARANLDFVDEDEILVAECSQIEEEKDEIFVSSNALANDIQFAFNDEALNSSDIAESGSDYDNVIDIEPQNIDNFQESLYT